MLTIHNTPNPSPTRCLNVSHFNVFLSINPINSLYPDEKQISLSLHSIIYSIIPTFNSEIDLIWYNILSLLFTLPKIFIDELSAVAISPLDNSIGLLSEVFNSII